MKTEIETVTILIDTLLEFLVSYGFQILGALMFLAVGLVLSNWIGRQMARLATAKNIDPTLSRFIGNIARLVLIAFVAVITLGNFGITITPLIALAGASAFGATLAIQGPLSNYGAGLSIILARPFVVGNAITVKDHFGVVEEVSLGSTLLVGEDGERIRIPNKEIVGQIVVNSNDSRVVETRIFVTNDADVDCAVAVLRKTLTFFPELESGPAAQIGVHDFTYGGVILGMRYWVPSKNYFQKRYAVNTAALKALRDAEITLLAPATVAVAAATTLSKDDTRQ